MSKFVVVYYLFPFFALISTTICAQTSKEMLSKIKDGKPDTGRVHLMLDLSHAILLKSGGTKKDIDSAYDLMRQAYLSSIRLNNAMYKGRSELMAALIFNKIKYKDRGLQLSQRALARFISINDLKDEAEAYIIIGQHYDNDGKGLDQKIVYYKKAINIFKQTGAKERMAITLVDLADLLILKDDEKANNDAFDNLFEALQIYKSIGYKKLQVLYDLFGVSYTNRADFESALKYELMAVKTAEALNDTTQQLCTIYNRTGVAFYYLRKFDQAGLYFNKALIVARKYADSDAIKWVVTNQANTLTNQHKYQQALDRFKSIAGMSIFHKDKWSAMYLEYLLCGIYIHLRDYTDAKLHLDKLNNLSKGNDILRERVMNANIKYYISTEQYQYSYKYLRASDSLTRKAKDFDRIATNYYMWFQADSALRRYPSAVKHYQLYKLYNDSLLNLTKSKQVAQLQLASERDKKVLQQENNIGLLKKESELQRNKARTSWNVFIAGSAMLLLLLVMTFNRYRLKQRSNLQLQNKQDEINHQNQKLEQLLTDKDILLAEKESLLTEKDSLLTEKDWLLKEVHHRVKNNLQIVMSLLSTQSAYVESSVALEAITNSQNRVQAISLIHHKLYNSGNEASIVMSGYIVDLVANLEDCFNTKFRRIRLEKHIDPVRMDIIQAVPIGLIFNEAVTNAIKYAFGEDGGVITITLKLRDSDHILFNITDNGKGLPDGFDILKSNSLGMEMMKALSKQLGGSFIIKNSPGVNMTVTFRLEHLHKPVPIQSHLENAT